MAHHCPYCGRLCYCDGEDAELDIPSDIENCTHYLECDYGEIDEDPEAADE